MARAKDAPTRVGGQIDPYVQRSIMQSKQLAESRLVAAMQEKGATGRAVMQDIGVTERTGMQEAGALERAEIQAATGRMGIEAQTERAGIQATTQRGIAAGRTASEDRRAAEDERARREDREFSKTMAEVTGKLQSEEAALNRTMQLAISEGRREDTKEIAAKQLAWDKVRAILGERAQIRQTNLIVSMTKGMRKSMENTEKVKTTMLGEADQFDMDKETYTIAKKSVYDAVANDKRMDFPARKPRVAFRGAGAGMTFPSPAEPQETLADPMGVLQDQIIKQDGKISIEDLSSANIHKIEEQMANEDIKTGDLNETFGVLDAMLEVLDEKRKGVDKKSDEFDFWNEHHINVTQFIRNLTKLEDSTKKIKGSEIKTVGKTMIYALRTIRRGSLGNRVSRHKAAGGNMDAEALIDEFSGPLEPYELFDLTDMDLDKYDIEARTFINESIYPLYQQTEIGGLE